MMKERFWKFDAGTVIAVIIQAGALMYYLGEMRAVVSANTERSLKNQEAIAEFGRALANINASGSEAFRHRNKELSLIYERVEERVSKLEDSLKDLAAIRADLLWIRAQINRNENPERNKP